MKIYNTLTRQKEELKTVKPNTVKIYVCGPTVYNYIHVGNARPICVFDTLRRYLEYKGYNVEYVQNFTDVDDKIIKRANEENVSYSEIPERYIKEFLIDTKGLNVKAPTYAPKVSENMNEIIQLVQTLIDKGHAYKVDNDVYFRTKSFDEYGKLSHMPLEELEAGARIEVNSVKEDPMDFALWKGAKPNEPSWEAPFGNGRPGWHIECSAMAKRYLGDTIDIHCGGQDLVFPHHENEIAQSECANGVCFSHYWMHNAYINIDNKKMSKSLNNFFTTREIANKYGYEPIRFLMIQSHYRSQINFTSEVIESCIASLQRLYNCKDSLNRVSDFGEYNDISKLEEYFNNFINALDDDFNTADAISFMFELVREINKGIMENPTKEYVEKAKASFFTMCDILGLLYQNKEDDIPAEVLELAEKRKQARKDKDFALADILRDEIANLGYSIEETRQGTRIIKK